MLSFLRVLGARDAYETRVTFSEGVGLVAALPPCELAYDGEELIQRGTRWARWRFLADDTAGAELRAAINAFERAVQLEGLEQRRCIRLGIAHGLAALAQSLVEP